MKKIIYLFFTYLVWQSSEQHKRFRDATDTAAIPADWTRDSNRPVS